MSVNMRFEISFESIIKERENQTSGFQRLGNLKQTRTNLSPLLGATFLSVRISVGWLDGIDVESIDFPLIACVLPTVVLFKDRSSWRGEEYK